MTTAERIEHEAKMNGIRKRLHGKVERMKTELKRRAMKDAKKTVGDVWGGVCLSRRDYRKELLHAYRLRLAYLTGKPASIELEPIPGSYLPYSLR